jgi:hypothetical protein
MAGVDLMFRQSPSGVVLRFARHDAICFAENWVRECRQRFTGE